MIDFRATPLTFLPHIILLRRMQGYSPENKILKGGVGDGSPEEPADFGIATAFPLELSAAPDTVEIAEELKFEKNFGFKGRPPVSGGLFSDQRLDFLFVSFSGEAQLGQIE